VKAIAVLDRTKEPGAAGEPMYEDVRTGMAEVTEAGIVAFNTFPKIVGGRYGLGSAEFNPGMVKGVLDNLAAKEPKNHFTIGINDDVMETSLEYDENFITEADTVHRAMFFGLGSDGTVGANKNSIKIIGKATDNFAQGYFVYDSKKAGAMTVSHLRFGPQLINSTYLIQDASFIACHKFNFIEKVDMLRYAREEAVFLLASPYSKDEIWEHVPESVQAQMIKKKIKFYVIDAFTLAEQARMGTRINTIMQTAFFLISGVLKEEKALALIKDAVVDSYGKRGQEIVDRNIAAIELAKSGIEQVEYPSKTQSGVEMKKLIPDDAPQFVKEVTAELMAGRGDKIPVSKLPDDGTYPTGTTKYEKRAIAEYIPVWEPDTCIQCGDCSAVCPHASIRMKAYDPKYAENAPATFKSTDARGKEFSGLKFTIQVAPEDCTGCSLCANICPAFEKKDGEKTDRKAINMEHMLPLVDQEKGNWEHFLQIPDTDLSLIKRNTTKGSQLLRPLFEFSGACAGCGETPYVKRLSQLFGDRALIGNATGCSSIYGGNLPTTPYTTSWSNSLFEDAAEFSMGFRLTADKLSEYCNEILDDMIANGGAGTELLKNIRNNGQKTQEEIEQQRAWVADLKKGLEKSSDPRAANLLAASDYLVRRSVWALGGDGWAYDIGYGGLDHVIASGKNVNILVMDTEVYSNTGGQMSKATPTGAIAKFAAGGKLLPKKDLGLMAMSYGYVYVAKVAMGYNRIQTIRAFLEAEAYDGPSIIIAYCHCIPGHGIAANVGLDQQKAAVNSGVWPLFRYNPEKLEAGENPLSLDSREPSIDIEDYLYKEIRFKALTLSKPEDAERMLKSIRTGVKRQYENYKAMADRKYS
jgi:pyruvate-ferredoxin/flavodoxin oxidoreductase